jgi:bifunctional NMN adenylyltransferase/nudix hydrolase
MNKSWSDKDALPNNKFDLSVVIGRFQPFHNGHKYLLATADALSENKLVLVGSSFKARDTRNPFTFRERHGMIHSVVGDKWNILPIVDDLYNDQVWVGSVQSQIHMVLEDKGIDPKTARVAIVGHTKDSTSYYLRMFPGYTMVDPGSAGDLDATDIREKLLTRQFEKVNKSFILPFCVGQLIENWTKHNSETYETLCGEYDFVEKYKQQFSNLPYPPVFVTCDAVVICHGHILLVKRRSHPGKGLWALPGGFLNQNETILQGIMRELKEETRIKVDLILLQASMKGFPRVFDHPKRSLRGRTITHAGLFVLDQETLPRVRGDDDAEKAQWIPLAEFYDGFREKMFEDHDSIINYMVGRAS